MRIVKYSALFLFCFLLACKGKQQTVSDKKGSEDVADPVAQIEPTVGLGLGNKAPEIAFKNPKDSVIKLSSVKDKLVLIDFWASWCGPCRHENPTVVKAYQTYKDKKFKDGRGFTVYSISLDSDKARWQQAIEKDGLAWPYHVSDLKMWGSEAVSKYNIQGIPTNVLINNKGIIIAKDLRGETLIEALEKQLIN